jgi:hypothetical protein
LVSNFIRYARELSFSYPVVVFGQKIWEDYSSLDLEYLMNLRIHFASHSFVDYSREDVKTFVAAYRERFKTEPDAFAFAGYDIGIYYLSALHLYGKNFHNCLGNFMPGLLQADHAFKKIENGGWENTRIRFYRYENFRVIDAVANPLQTVEVNKRN